MSQAAVRRRITANNAIGSFLPGGKAKRWRVWTRMCRNFWRLSSHRSPGAGCSSARSLRGSAWILRLITGALAGDACRSSPNHAANRPGHMLHAGPPTTRATPPLFLSAFSRAAATCLAMIEIDGSVGSRLIRASPNSLLRGLRRMLGPLSPSRAPRHQERSSSPPLRSRRVCTIVERHGISVNALI